VSADYGLKVGDVVEIDEEKTTGVVVEIVGNLVRVASESEPDCALWFEAADLVVVVPC
jgi:methyl coenzyme M reductase subunit C